MTGLMLRFMWRRHRVGCALCCVGPVLIGVAIGLIYPTYSEQRALMNVMKFATRLFGQGDLDLFSAVGAFTLPFQHPLVQALLAVVVAVPTMTLPAGERGRGALDLLLASPLERHALIGTQVAFLAIVAPLFAMAAFGGAWLGAVLSGVAGQIPWVEYVVVALNLAALTMLFGAIGLVVSVFARDRAVATMIYACTCFLLLLIDVAARLWKKGEWLGWLTPYGLCRPPRIVGQGMAYGFRDTAILLALAVAFLAVAWIAQERRRSA